MGQGVGKVSKDEVSRAVKRMKSGKTVGPDDIPVEVGEVAGEFLNRTFNKVLESICKQQYGLIPKKGYYRCNICFQDVDREVLRRPEGAALCLCRP